MRFITACCTRASAARGANCAISRFAAATISSLLIPRAMLERS
jgi:hypothetical protein